MLRNPVTQAILVGQLLVNLPSILIGLFVPVLFRTLLEHYGLPVGQEWVVISMVIGMLVSVLWWAFSITYWRIWAFRRVEGRQILTLQKRATQFLLIHHADYASFDALEIRSRRQRKQLQIIFDSIWAERELHHLFYVVNTHPHIAYGIDHRKLYKEFVLRALFAIAGILIILYSPVHFLGLIFTCMAMLSGSPIESIYYPRASYHPLVLNRRGIQLNFPQKQFIYWDSIRHYSIDIKLRKMIVELSDQLTPQQLDLSYSVINDYELLHKRIEFFRKQDAEAEWSFG
ncbi:MAG: hypothetical protein AAGK47_04040 [Bacteroidota bacterium]